MPHTNGNKNAYALASRLYMEVMGPSKFNIEDSFGTDIVVSLFKTQESWSNEDNGGQGWNFLRYLFN